MVGIGGGTWRTAPAGAPRAVVRSTGDADNPPRVETWNVLVTAFEGRRDALMPLLRALGTFRGGGYRNVAVGRVADVPALLDALAATLAREPWVRDVLARVVPVERTLAVDPADPVAALEPAVLALAPRLAGGSFHVRVERRGLKGALDTAAVERALGGAAWRALEAAGAQPRVTFRDPDRVLVVETLGARAGVGIVDRAVRARWPFVRVG